MQFARRLIRWALFLGCFSAIGGGVFAYVRSQPRCTIEGPSGHALFLSADGARLLTYQSAPPNSATWRVWDTHSGRQLFEWANSEHEGRSIAYSSDGRYVADTLENGVVRLIDWQNGEHWDFDEPPDMAAPDLPLIMPANLLNMPLPFHPRGDMYFSAKDRWLLADTGRGRPSFLIDVAARKVALRSVEAGAVISSDERLLFVYKSSEPGLAVWDLDEGKPRGMLPAVRVLHRVSADGPLLAVRHLDRAAERDQVIVWDVAKSKQRFHRKVSKNVNWLETEFSPDSRRLAIWGKDDESNLEMIDTTTGELLWSHALKAGGHCDFSTDSTLICLFQNPEIGNAWLTVLDAGTGEVLWRRPYRSSWFAKNAGAVLHIDDHAKPMLFLDLRTGEPKNAMPANFGSTGSPPHLTPDDRHFFIEGQQQRGRAAYFWEAWLDKHWPTLLHNEASAVLVMETATGRELFRAVDCGDSALLSADGGTLATVVAHDQLVDGLFVIRVWDVHPTKAWLWAIGVAQAAAVGWQFVLLRLVRALRRGKTSTRKQSPSSAITTKTINKVM